MSNKAETDVLDMGEAPENREKEYVKPGYRKLTIKEFEYKPAEAGKTPLITMKAEAKGEEGTIDFAERFYISGKKDKDGKWPSILRLQELYKGFTGESKMPIENPKPFKYTKKEADGSTKEYTIVNPEDLVKVLTKAIKGKSAIFKIGGEEDEGKVFAKLVYSGFLYYADKKGNMTRYNEEGDFSDAEYKYNVKKKKSAEAPAHGGAIASPSQLDEL